jgi:hypothetical protein
LKINLINEVCVRSVNYELVRGRNGVLCQQ